MVRKRHTCCEGLKRQPQSLFSGKKFSENTVKIILKKSKTKGRVTLFIFFKEFFYKFLLLIELINSI